MLPKRQPSAQPTSPAAPEPQLRLLAGLRTFLGNLDGLRPGALLLVAFSAGPDSTALLWALTLLAPEFGFRLHAAHLDHRLDPDSERRADHAQALAERLGVPFSRERLASTTPPGTSLEAHAREARYDFLHRLAEELRALSVLTAHHADDQAETVLLRWLYGSGLFGLGGIQPQRGRLARPLLALRRQEIHRALATTDLRPVQDPTNLNPHQPRSGVRHRLLPALGQHNPHLVPRLCRLADATRRASQRLDRLLRGRLTPRRVQLGASLDRAAFGALPPELQAPALALLARDASAPYPPTAQARAELLRQLDRGGRVGCDCGHGFRFAGDRRTLRMVRKEPSVGDFAYTLEVPGAIEIPELARTVHLRRGKVARWMYQGLPDRAGIWCPDLVGRRVVIRNRRPGDHLRPLGSDRDRRLKDMLIDSCIPREERDALPLLVIDEEIAWVPGMTLSECFRLPADARRVWIATLEGPDIK